MDGLLVPRPGHRRPWLGEGMGRRTRRLVVCAASMAAVAVAGVGLVASSGPRTFGLVERLPDTGEDYFSAIEQPHKIYEWPWLKDQKLQYDARVLGYGPPETWDRERDGHLAHNAYMGWNHGYKRTAFDEYGDRAFDVDMRPAQGCYDADSWDCYREEFDADTGYLLPSADDAEDS